jgi:ribonucleoside-diphosphate reductase alpha chain
MSNIDFRKEMADYKFYKDYSRNHPVENRRLTWKEVTDGVFNMHSVKFKEFMNNDRFVKLMNLSKSMMYDKKIIPSMRSVQFFGDYILKHNARIYNCSASYADRVEFFKQAMYLLLCGTGVGFSVEKRYTEKLPTIKKPGNIIAVYVVRDSIEGWSDALHVLLDSYFRHDENYSNYHGKIVQFDYRLIRPKGSLIGKDFIAPGHEGLEQSLELIRSLLNKLLEDKNETKLRPIDVYDIVMHSSDAVLSGGVRRSATLCQFDFDDVEMMNAKTGNWWVDNPQRQRSNNSACIYKDTVSKKDYDLLFEKTKQFGEPGFLMLNRRGIVVNPCCEISMYPQLEDGRTGFQMCNLTEINASNIKNEDEFLMACTAASFLGTLQAAYTDFPYLGEATEEIVRRDALLGVSITGIFDNIDMIGKDSVLKEGAEQVVITNDEVSKILKINKAARTTCIKPSGTASIILGCTSGIHPDHSKRYIRNVQSEEYHPLVQELKRINPYMVEKSSASNTGTDVVISFPIESKSKLFKDSVNGVDHLEIVKNFYKNWVVPGTRNKDGIYHNVSNTIVVKDGDWNKVRDYLWENMDYFTGVSLLPEIGDKIYKQAPLTSVMDEKELVDKFGLGAIFASGLIVDGIHAFGDLWQACEMNIDSIDKSDDKRVLKIDWINRLRKFAVNYFNNDIDKAIMCLKEVHSLHKFNKIKLTYNRIDYSKFKLNTEVSTTGAAACSGGACEI